MKQRFKQILKQDSPLTICWQSSDILCTCIDFFNLNSFNRCFNYLCPCWFHKLWYKIRYSQNMLSKFVSTLLLVYSRRKISLISFQTNIHFAPLISAVDKDIFPSLKTCMRNIITQPMTITTSSLHFHISSSTLAIVAALHKLERDMTNSGSKTFV